MTARLLELAARHCGGRLVSSLEGGYNLSALARSVVAHLRVLARL
jgi:acetoin utilization deacetylase AcuC-like enzyme